MPRRATIKPLDLEDLSTGKEIAIILHLLASLLDTGGGYDVGDGRDDDDIVRQTESFIVLLKRVKKWSGAWLRLY